MNVFSIILRYIRGGYRLIKNGFVFFRFRILLIMNNVKHGHITSNGMPYIAVVPGGKCVFGDNLTMNNGLRFNPIGYPQPCTIVVTRNATLTIGENVGLSQASIICHHSIKIGDNVKIGGGVKIYDTNFHSLNPQIRRVHQLDMELKKVLPVVIENDVFIGAGAVILPGVIIGANSIIGAGAVVAKSIPPNQIWGGNPARYIKDVPIDNL